MLLQSALENWKEISNYLQIKQIFESSLKCCVEHKNNVDVAHIAIHNLILHAIKSLESPCNKLYNTLQIQEE